MINQGGELLTQFDHRYRNHSAHHIEPAFLGRDHALFFEPRRLKDAVSSQLPTGALPHLIIWLIY